MVPPLRSGLPTPLNFPQSRNPGAGRQRFDSGEPFRDSVEEEAHTEGQSRV